MRIYVALDPRSHRETLCDAIAQLRPRFDAVAVALDELERRPGQCARAIVLLSRSWPAVQERAFAWLVVGEGTGASTLVSIAGRERTIDKFELSELLAVLDECQVAERAGRALPPGEPLDDLPPVPSPLVGFGGWIVARWRALLGAVAPWQYVHAVLAAGLLLVIYRLAYQGRAATLEPIDSVLILYGLGGIAALEVRQYRRTHGARGCA